MACRDRVLATALAAVSLSAVVPSTDEERRDAPEAGQLVAGNTRVQGAQCDRQKLGRSSAPCDELAVDGPALGLRPKARARDSGLHSFGAARIVLPAHAERQFLAAAGRPRHDVRGTWRHGSGYHRCRRPSRRRRRAGLVRNERTAMYTRAVPCSKLSHILSGSPARRSEQNVSVAPPSPACEGPINVSVGDWPVKWQRRDNGIVRVGANARFLDGSTSPASPRARGRRAPRSPPPRTRPPSPPACTTPAPPLPRLAAACQNSVIAAAAEFASRSWSSSRPARRDRRRGQLDAVLFAPRSMDRQRTAIDGPSFPQLIRMKPPLATSGRIALSSDFSLLSLQSKSPPLV